MIGDTRSLAKEFRAQAERFRRVAFRLPSEGHRSQYLAWAENLETRASAAEARQGSLFGEAA